MRSLIQSGGIAAVVSLAMLTGCQTTGSSSLQSTPTSAEMPPVSERRAVLGDTSAWVRNNGEEFTSRTTAVDAQFVSAQQSSGCKWTSRLNAFAPTTEWINCDGSSGRQTSKRIGDSIFPLAVGKTETWEYSGTNNKGDSWNSTRRCEVIRTANVTVPGGTFDTYHVRCEDKWWVREWFIRADGVSVQGGRTRKVGSSDRNRSWKLVSFTPAASS